AAMMLDGLLQAVIWLPLFFLMGFANVQSQNLNAPSAAAGSAGLQIVFQLIQFAVMIGYEGLFLQFKGATPGKMALGLRVVGPDDEPLTPGQAWLRPFIRSLIGACLGIDYIVSLFRKDK